MKFVTGERVANALHKAGAFFSFIIGLGLSVLIFHRDFSSIRVPALPLNEITDKTVKVDGKCFQYRVEDASCETSSFT